MRMAFKAPKAVDKAFWLRFAAYWLELRDKAHGPDDEKALWEEAYFP